MSHPQPALTYASANPVEPRVVAPEAFDPDIFNILRLASSVIALISRDHEVTQRHRLKPVLASARSALEQATAILCDDASPLCDRPGVLDVADLLRDMQPLLHMICRSGQRLILTMSRCLPTISCEAVALEAVLQSLVTHACRELGGGGEIRVDATATTDHREAHGFLLTIRCRRSPCPNAMAAGPGPEGHHAHRRDRIGLAMAMRLAQAKGGHIHVDRPDCEQLVIVMQLPAPRPRPGTAPIGID